MPKTFRQFLMGTTSHFAIAKRLVMHGIEDAKKKAEADKAKAR